MCIVMNTSRQTNTMLLQVDKSPIDAEITLQDNIIFTSRSEMPSKYKEKCVRVPSPWVVLISQFIDMRDTHDFNSDPTVDVERAAIKSGGAVSLDTPKSSCAG